MERKERLRILREEHIQENIKKANYKMIKMILSGVFVTCVYILMIVAHDDLGRKVVYSIIALGRALCYVWRVADIIKEVADNRKILKSIKSV